MTDRLEEIKQHIFNISPNLPYLVGQVKWLITEVERLQEECDVWKEMFERQGERGEDK